MKQNTIVAVDLGGTNLRVGKIENQSIVQRNARAVPITDSDGVVLQELISAIQTVFDGDVAAIGIGVPSLVDVEQGIVYAVQNIPSWKEVHLKERLEEVFPVPVYVNNDANCLAVGECHYGKGRSYNDMVALAVGTGLGAGIIIHRRLYNGHNCGAGEIGTIPYKGETVETYCSGQFFPKECEMSGERVFERAISGDADAIRAYEKFGVEMAHALMIALYAYDPQIVVFGGSVSKAFHFFKESMMRRVKEMFAYQHALQRLVVEASELPDVALLGAAALHLDAMEKFSHESTL
jgi:glucokinase